jgi:hypothetical protein
LWISRGRQHWSTPRWGEKSPAPFGALEVVLDGMRSGLESLIKSILCVFEKMINTGKESWQFTLECFRDGSRSPAQASRDFLLFVPSRMAPTFEPDEVRIKRPHLLTVFALLHIFSLIY